MNQKTIVSTGVLFLLVLQACGGSTSSSSASSSSSIASSSLSVEDYAKRDVLSVSKTRLASIDFNVNLDALVSADAPLSRLSSRFVQTQSVGDVEVNDSSVTYLSLPDSSNIGLEFRNLNQNIASAAFAAQQEVEWAITTLSRLDTWVVSGSTRYLLTYDAIADVVTLTSANVSFTSLEDDYMVRSIQTYFQDGLQVVEVYDAYAENNYASFGHLTFIQDEYYEWSSDIWVNGVKEANPSAGGSGWFKAIKNPTTERWSYWRSTDANVSFNVQTSTGWLQTFVRISQFDLEPNVLATFNYVKVGNPSLTNDVMTWLLNADSTLPFSFYPQAFSGWDSIVASLDDVTLRNLQDWTPDNQDYVLYEASEAVVNFSNNVAELPSPLTTTVRPSNIDTFEGEGYVGYVAESSTILPVNYLDALPLLLEFFDTLGLTYKDGPLDTLIMETVETVLNFPRLFDQFELGGEKGLTDLSKLWDVIDEEMTLIASLPSFVLDQDTLYPQLNLSDLPPSLDNALLTLPTLNGAATFDNETQTITTASVSTTLPASSLLLVGASYTMMYALTKGQQLFVIGEEEAVEYSNSSLTFVGDTTLTLPVWVEAGDYSLVTYVAKVDDQSRIRLSNVELVPFTAFTPLSFTVALENGFTLSLTTSATASFVATYVYEDTSAPIIYGVLNEEPFSFQGRSLDNVLSVSLVEEVTVYDFIQFLNFEDNSYETILFALDQLTFNGTIVESFSEALQVGTYEVLIQDASGNLTNLILTVTA